MTNSLIEKVKRLLMDKTLDTFEQNAKDTIDAVLDHFSDPENITEDGMARAATEAGIYYNLMESPHQEGEKNIRWQWRFRIAMAMKAAKEELSSDIKPKSTHPD